MPRPNIFLSSEFSPSQQILSVVALWASAQLPRPSPEPPANKVSQTTQSSSDERAFSPASGSNSQPQVIPHTPGDRPPPPPLAPSGRDQSLPNVTAPPSPSSRSGRWPGSAIRQGFPSPAQWPAEDAPQREWELDKDSGQVHESHLYHFQIHAEEGKGSRIVCLSVCLSVRHAMQKWLAQPGLSSLALVCPQPL